MNLTQSGNLWENSQMNNIVYCVFHHYTNKNNNSQFTMLHGIFKTKEKAEQTATKLNETTKSGDGIYENYYVVNNPLE